MKVKARESTNTTLSFRGEVDWSDPAVYKIGASTLPRNLFYERSKSDRIFQLLPECAICHELMEDGDGRQYLNLYDSQGKAFPVYADLLSSTSSIQICTFEPDLESSEEKILSSR